MNIILCGLPGSGKTTVGMLLAKKLQWFFLDTDCLIEDYYFERSGTRTTCRQLFAKFGEKQFRKWEKEAILALSPTENRILATGGGVLNEKDNILILKSIGKIIYLKNQPRILFERITQNQLPAYLDPKDPYASFEKIVAIRTPVYENCANITLDTQDLTPEEVASLILTQIGNN